MKEALKLVLGGTGKTGRRVAQGLQARGLGVRIGSRAAVPAFDWDDARTWPAARRVKVVETCPVRRKAASVHHFPQPVNGGYLLLDCGFRNPHPKRRGYLCPTELDSTFIP